MEPTDWWVQVLISLILVIFIYWLVEIFCQNYFYDCENEADKILQIAHLINQALARIKTEILDAIEMQSIQIDLLAST